MDVNEIYGRMTKEEAHDMLYILVMDCEIKELCDTIKEVYGDDDDLDEICAQFAREDS